MGTVDDAATLYETALSLSRAAFAGRHYAMAYHALAGAMHAAFDHGDDERLVAVGNVAHEQGSWLDKHDPGNELSSRSAATRGSQSLWSSLQREVETRRQMLQGRRLLDQTHPRTGG